MKKFNLEEAINGKAFYLENGYRGVIKYCVDNNITQYKQPPNYPYVGYVLDDKGFLFVGHTAWNENGKSNEYQSFNATTMVDDTPLQDNKKETMKKFDLKAALNGEPVKLRSGHKAIILNDARNYFKDAKCNEEVLLGAISKINNHDELLCAGTWLSDGSWMSNDIDEFDIIEMWEEPKISIEDLPKPFKPKDDEPFYYIYCGKIYCDHEYSESSPSYKSFSQNGQCFRTEEDAQKWLDFMKGMLE